MSLRVTVVDVSASAGPSGTVVAALDITSVATRPLIATVEGTAREATGGRPPRVIVHPGETLRRSFAVALPGPGAAEVTLLVRPAGGEGVEVAVPTSAPLPVPVSVPAPVPPAVPHPVPRGAVPPARRRAPAPILGWLVAAVVAVGIAAVALHGGSGSSGPEASDPTAELGGAEPATRVQGSVVVPDGVAPEEVMITFDGEPLAGGVTPDGAFESGLAPGRYLVHVSAPGCLPHQQTVVVSGASVDLPTIELVLGGAAVRGVVRSTDGRPIGGAQVGVVVEGLVVAASDTSPDGGYLADGLDAPGSVLLRFSVEVEIAVAVGEIVGAIDVILAPA